LTVVEGIFHVEQVSGELQKTAVVPSQMRLRIVLAKASGGDRCSGSGGNDVDVVLRMVMLSVVNSDGV
jgi:hypothetical protein